MIYLNAYSLVLHLTASLIHMALLAHVNICVYMLSIDLISLDLKKTLTK